MTGLRNSGNTPLTEQAEALIAAYRKKFVDDYVAGSSPPPGVPVEWYEDRGREAMERFEKAATDGS